MTHLHRGVIIGLLIAAAPSWASEVVYETGAPTGYFTPFDSSTPTGTKFGDSGWFGSGGDMPVGITLIRLGLAVFGEGATVPTGSTDIVFTLNDGDPSGLVFGPGTELYSSTITNVVLPEGQPTQPTYFDLDIPIPNVLTSGGFNNFGFSLAVENFNYNGSFGFQNRGNFNVLGFYTNNASQFTPGVGWSLFAFGPNDPADIANFVMYVEIPEPASLSLIGVGLLTLTVRRRR
jgi:hypothetical protein